MRWGKHCSREGVIPLRAFFSPSQKKGERGKGGKVPVPSILLLPDNREGEKKEKKGKKTKNCPPVFLLGQKKSRKIRGGGKTTLKPPWEARGKDFMP